MPPQRSSQAVGRNESDDARIHRAYPRAPGRCRPRGESPTVSDSAGVRPYHQPVLLEPLPIALGLGIALLVLLPARRLQLAGFRARWILAYAVITWALGFFLALRPFAARFLVPILVLLYIAPFVTAPERMTQIVRRTRGAGRGDPPRPPMKNVTPPDPPTGSE